MLGGIQRNLVASVADRFTARHLEWFFGETTTDGCAELVNLIAEGTVSPAIDRRVGLDGVVGVIEAMQRGELRGQAVVLDVGGGRLHHPQPAHVLPDPPR